MELLDQLEEAVSTLLQERTSLLAELQKLRASAADASSLLEENGRLKVEVGQVADLQQENLRLQLLLEQRQLVADTAAQRLDVLIHKIRQV